MPPLLDSLVAVFLVIGAGWAARASGLVEERHWPGLERVTYVIFFPAVLVDTLMRAKLGTIPVAGVAGALVGAILLMSGILLALRPATGRVLGLTGPDFTSLFQGATRWNTFVALAIAGNLHGAEGLTLMAIAVAAMIPLLNVLAIVVLTRFARTSGQPAPRLLRSIATNPFILSVALGLFINLAVPPLPAPVTGFIDVVGRAALAAGLLVVGATLDLRSMARPRAVHGLAIALKLLVMPLLAWGLARLAGLEGMSLTIVVIAAAVPTASGSYILARQMGGNAPLMAEILTWQTILALATMPVVLSLMGGR